MAIVELKSNNRSRRILSVCVYVWFGKVKSLEMLFTNGYLFHFSGMTDYRAEQKDEIEAIESIYSEEISIISDNPHRS